MKKSWLEAQTIRDIAQGNPNELYHPDIAKYYDTDVPDDAANGDTWDGTTLTKPVQPEFVQLKVIAVPPTVSVIEYKLLFTVQERIATKNSTDPVIVDLQELMNDARTTVVDLSLKSIQEALDYMTTLNILGAGRKAEILTGIVK
jgi:hypothetical protein